MNEKCHGTKSYISVTLPYRFNSYVSQVSQKEKFSFCDTWLTLELHLYGSVTERKLFFLWHFLFIETSSMSPLKNLLSIPDSASQKCRIFAPIRLGPNPNWVVPKSWLGGSRCSNNGHWGKYGICHRHHRHACVKLYWFG